MVDVYRILLEIVESKYDLDGCINGIYLGDTSGERKETDINRASIRVELAWKNAIDYIDEKEKVNGSNA